MEAEKDMKRLNFIAKGLASIACLALAAVVFQPAEIDAQATPDNISSRYNLRSLISNSYNNIGGMGGNQEWGRGYRRNAYPWNGNGPGSFGAVLSQFTSNQKSQMYNDYKVSGGEGIWMLNADAGTVTVTGPRENLQIVEHNQAFPYDPVGNPEENWGQPNPLNQLAELPNSAISPGEQGAGGSLSNYWPGVTADDDGSLYGANWDPVSTPPAHIANYNLGAHNLVDVTIPEETIIAQWIDKQNGIRVQRRVYSWSNPDFDDFYIVDLTFTNIGDFDGDGVGEAPGPINNLYIAFKNVAAMTAMGILEEFGWNFYASNARGMDDTMWFTEAGGYPNAFSQNGAFAGEDMRAVIRRDSDNPFSSHDDTGDPFFKAIVPSNYNILQTEGQPRAPSTYFMAPLAYADDAGKFSFNEADRGKYVQPGEDMQPRSFQWWLARSTGDFDDPTYTTHSAEQLASVITTTGFQANPDEGDISTRKVFHDMTVYGPYNVGVDESVKLVFSWGAGHPSLLAPIPANEQDIGLIKWDRSSDSPENKIQKIKTDGEMAALENLKLAHWVYDNNYQVPASPTEAYISADNLTSSTKAKQLIRWGRESESAVNPYTGEQDILGVRLYKSEWFSWGPWELYGVIENGSSGSSVSPAGLPRGEWGINANGVYEYEDLETTAGFSYFYSARPYARGVDSYTWNSGMTIDDIPSARVQANIRRGYESGWGPSTARTYDGDNRKPFQALLSGLPEEVLIVPNPYYVDGVHQYPNSRNLRVVGLTADAIIHIYSASGDRVETTDRTPLTKGETEFRQISFNIAGEVQTGLYYFVVVSGGETRKGSFVLIK